MRSYGENIGHEEVVSKVLRSLNSVTPRYFSDIFNDLLVIVFYINKAFLEL